MGAASELHSMQHTKRGREMTFWPTETKMLLWVKGNEDVQAVCAMLGDEKMLHFNKYFMYSAKTDWRGQKHGSYHFNYFFKNQLQPKANAAVSMRSSCVAFAYLHVLCFMKTGHHAV